MASDSVFGIGSGGESDFEISRIVLGAEFDHPGCQSRRQFGGRIVLAPHGCRISNLVDDPPAALAGSDRLGGGTESGRAIRPISRGVNGGGNRLALCALSFAEIENCVVRGTIARLRL